MEEKRFWVYMLASHKNGTLYVGMTSELVQRTWKHKEKFYEGFTKKYGVKTLVWYEEHGTAEDAIRKEKRLKKYLRQWKINLINEMNPEWKDLYDEIIQ